MVGLLQGSLDGFQHFGCIGFGFRLEAGKDLAVFADEELAEVPFDVSGEGGFRAAKCLVEWVFLWAFDDDFIEQGEADAVFGGAELLDFLIAARFLTAKVVAGEAEDGEAVVREGLVQCLQFRVLLGVAALGGHIDDEHHFAFIGLEVGFFAFDILERDFIKVAGGDGSCECD